MRPHTPRLPFRNALSGLTLVTVFALGCDGEKSEKGPASLNSQSSSGGGVTTAPSGNPGTGTGTTAGNSQGGGYGSSGTAGTGAKGGGGAGALDSTSPGTGGSSGTSPGGGK